MSLRRYHKKRDFSRTSEPSGRKAASAKKKKSGLRFVIQKHDASHLHYDFRLEIGGSLKSWAVPKGPSLDPAVKRLAMHVEDHPLDYGSFEGSIPQGEYGGGTVMLWDQGYWKPDTDPEQAYRKGSLKFEVLGEKLQGRWALFRIRGKTENTWLLVKEKDKFVKRGTRDTLLKQDRSVKSGRSMNEIESFASLQNLRITHPEKVLYPDGPFSKRDLLEYYLKVGPKMLEHVADRPLMLVRCTENVNAKCFYQKNWSRSMPAAIKKFKVKGDEDSLLRIDSLEGLLTLVQLGSLEIHTWGTHFANIESPDQLIFDVDPDEGVAWKLVAETAVLLRKQLRKFKLESFLKTTGGKGLHVCVPLEAGMSWDLGKAFAKAICEDLTADYPARYLTTMSKAKRKGKIFLDYLRNGRGSTAVAPYSTRARPGATISLPIRWQDLEKGARSDSFTIESPLKTLLNKSWDGYLELEQFPVAKTSTTSPANKRAERR
jgi:bifunctional non-homologous end joining protein LigD